MDTKQELGENLGKVARDKITEIDFEDTSEYEVIVQWFA